MEVFHGQQIREARFEPTGFGQCLTLGAMAIATRVVSDALVATRIALLNMSTQAGSPTALDGAHYAPLLWRQRVRESEVVPVLAEDVGHLQRWSHAYDRSSSTLRARNSSGLGAARTALAET
jgi:hypothetical protein